MKELQELQAKTASRSLLNFWAKTQRRGNEWKEFVKNVEKRHILNGKIFVIPAKKKMQRIA